VKQLFQIPQQTWFALSHNLYPSTSPNIESDAVVRLLEPIIE
jgi:hypothetical protein